jgi:hypothetical protein
MDDEKALKIHKRIFAFIEKNKKKYSKKIKTDLYTIYEYEDHYEFFPNKKTINIKDTIKELFGENKLTAIKIDGYERTNIDSLEEDFKRAKTIKIRIEKPNQ